MTVVMAVVVLWELWLWKHATPAVFPDSWGYLNLAEALLAGNLSHEGFSFRTPGFPFFLAVMTALAGKPPWQAVIDAQFVLGSLIPLGLYILWLPLTRRKWLAAWGAGVYLLDRYFLLLQAVPLTEFLGGALLVFILAWFVRAFLRGHARESIALGLATGGWILVRPSFQLLPWYFVALGIAFWWLKRVPSTSGRRLARWLAGFVLGWQLPLFAWSANVYHFTGHWGLSHQLGASLTNHSGAFMEHAPSKFGVLRDRYVEEKRRRGGSWINVYDAIDDELTSLTGMRAWELSRTYMEIDRILLTRYWQEYLRQVWYAWRNLWQEPSSYIVDVDGDNRRMPQSLWLTNSPLGPVYAALDRHFWRPSRPDEKVSLPYVLLGLAVAVGYLRRRDGPALLTLMLVIGTVYYHMATHAAVQFTEFGRYRLPVQPLWWSFLFVAPVLLSVEIWKVLESYFEAGPRAGASNR